MQCCRSVHIKRSQISIDILVREIYRSALKKNYMSLVMMMLSELIAVFCLIEYLIIIDILRCTIMTHIYWKQLETSKIILLQIWHDQQLWFDWSQFCSETVITDNINLKKFIFCHLFTLVKLSYKFQINASQLAF